MLSDEEKKALEYIKNCLDNEYIFKNATRQKDKKAYNIILNLIEKQSKEIEELKDESKEYQIGFAQACYDKDLDWKDKIREFIKNELPDDEIMKCCNNYDVNGVRLRKELQKLLEEVKK